MMGRLKKEIVWILVMGFGLAFYQVYVENPYISSVEAGGGVPGVFEVGLGFVGAIMVFKTIAWLLTRKMES